MRRLAILLAAIAVASPATVQAQDGKLAFLMYPQAESHGERIDSLDPDTFKYKITAREITS